MTGLLTSPDADVWASGVSIWELRLKWNSLYRSGAREDTAAPGDVLAALETDIGCTLLRLLPHRAIEVLAVRLAHSDPFDELLLA